MSKPRAPWAARLLSGSVGTRSDGTKPTLAPPSRAYLERTFPHLVAKDTSNELSVDAACVILQSYSIAEDIAVHLASAACVCCAFRDAVLIVAKARAAMLGEPLIGVVSAPAFALLLVEREVAGYFPRKLASVGKRAFHLKGREHGGTRRATWRHACV